MTKGILRFNAPRHNQWLRYPLASALMTHFEFPELSAPYRILTQLDAERRARSIPGYRG